jgi:hypothetical protein
VTRKKIVVLVVTLIVVLLPASAFADGGGGFFYGLQSSAYPLFEDYPIRNKSLGLMYTGGYGYAASGYEIHGGFGVGLSDFESETGMLGGYGGVIYGLRGRLGPVNLMLTSWTGIGGLKFTDTLDSTRKSYVIVTEELDLELGLAVFRWFMPVVYAGYQVMGNITPGQPFRDFLTYTPVFGFRVAFGSFH